MTCSVCVNSSWLAGRFTFDQDLNGQKVRPCFLGGCCYAEYSVNPAGRAACICKFSHQVTTCDPGQHHDYFNRVQKATYHVGLQYHLINNYSQKTLNTGINVTQV